MTIKKPPKEHKKRGPKPDSRTPLLEGEVNNAYFSELLGFGDSKLREMGQQGMLVRTDTPGRYLQIPSLVNLIKAFISSEAETERATKQARRQKEENLVLRQEIEIAEKAKELTSTAMAEAVLAELLVTARQGLESMNVIIDSSSASVDDKSKCRQILSQTLTSCTETLERTAKQADEFYEEDEGFSEELEQR